MLIASKVISRKWNIIRSRNYVKMNTKSDPVCLSSLSSIFHCTLSAFQHHPFEFSFRSRGACCWCFSARFHFGKHLIFGFLQRAILKVDIHLSSLYDHYDQFFELFMLIPNGSERFNPLDIIGLDGDVRQQFQPFVDRRDNNIPMAGQ